MICTYLTTQEINDFTKVEDKELNELLHLPEVQIINFYIDESHSSISVAVYKSFIMAMFYGLINGHLYTKANGL